MTLDIILSFIDRAKTWSMKMIDFLKHRQNVVDDISKEEINAWIDKMLDYLGGEIWLNKSKNVDHPIVKLWNRKDFMATNELINFANAVNIMDGIDSKWTAQTMKEVAGKDFNNVHGAIFEILALSAFSESDCQILPASRGNPGIDGAIKLSNGTIINLSLKYYGISNAEKKFQNLMDEIECDIQKELKKRQLLSTEVVLTFKRYPETKADKKRTKDLIPLALEQHELNLKRATSLILEDELVNIGIRPIQGFNLANSQKSRKLIAVSPVYKNEYKNLRDKLDEACINLKKHSTVSDSTTYNGIVVHIHENADIDSYQSEMQNYLNDNAFNKEFPIDYIVLYQATISCNEKRDYAVYHTIKPSVNVKRLESTGRGRFPLPVVSFFIGYAGIDTPRRILLADNKELSELKDVYLYQKGEIFEEPQFNPDGSISGNIRMIAPGVRLSPVLPLSRGKSVIPKLITFENDHLEIT